MTVSQLQERIQKSPSLDFGDIFSRAINLFQKVWVQGLLLQLLVIAIYMGLYFIVALPMLGGAFILDGTEFEQSNELTGASLILTILTIALFILFILAFNIFIYGLLMAFYRIIRLKERNTTEPNVNFGMFFKRPHLKTTILFGLSHMGISLLAMLLCFLPIIYVFVPLQVAVVIRAFNPHLSIGELYKVAFELGNKKWFLIFGLTFVSGLLAYIVGLIACGIGIFITMTFMYIPVYIVYKDVIGFTEDDEAIASIGSSFS